ncbi:MAG TPA: lysophospholipid acyltransferase family protein [Pseudolysinimonas sp.]|nr:lysophospholipid acyltransferase family protein [Pseudolysinimonas sp.]
MGDRRSRRKRSEKTLTWRFWGAIVIPLVLLLAKFRFQHPERIPRSGAFIMTANHITDFDPLVTAYTLWKHGRVPHYLAKASLFRVPIIGRAFSATDQVPVERAVGGTEPLAAASKLIEKQLALVIYPEGTLTREPNLWPMRGKYGAMRLALQHGLPVIPCAQWGSQKVLPRWSKKLSLFPRKRIDVLIGEPLDLSRWEGRYQDTKALAEATEYVMQEITRLLEQLRGEKAPAGRWDPADHGQSEFGRD